VNITGQTFNYEVTMVYQIVDDLGSIVAEYTEAPQYVTSFPATLNYVADINTGALYWLVVGSEVAGTDTDVNVVVTSRVRFLDP